MRTETQVEGRDVFAIWSKGGASYLPVSATAFTRAVRLSGIGKTQEKRNFLSVSSGDSCVITSSNAVRQSCNAIFLDSLPVDLATSLKESIVLIKS